MDKPERTMAQQIALAATAFEEQTTGHVPRSVTVVLNDDTLVITEIKRITGVEVREATAEVETTTGTVVKVFATGTIVQVFLLARGVPADIWSGNGPRD